MLVALEAAWRALRGSTRGPRTEGLERFFILAILVTMAGGLGLLVGGDRPRETLHFLYAVVALGALAIVDSIARRAAPRRQAITSLVGALAALAVIARLFGTG